MDSLKETRRQLVGALVGIIVVFSIGVVGFSALIPFEPSLNNPLDALWLTTITLTTIGYGDIAAQTLSGRIFTIVLVLFGFGIVAYGLQAAGTFLISPQIRELREKKRTLRAIKRLNHHYIVCGSGELVDQIIAYLLKSVQMRLTFYDDKIYKPIDAFLDRLFGDDELGYYPRIRALVRQGILALIRPFARIGTLLDLIVVVTDDSEYARHLRDDGFFVLEGKPTDIETLQNAGIRRATAVMIALPDDTENLLTVLTARSSNGNLYITAATQEEAIAQKFWRVGANNVIQPFELAGQFLNSLTLRPTVYDFFSSILFDHTYDIQTTQINLEQHSNWVGKSIAELDLRQRYHACIIGIANGEFIIAPPDDHTLNTDEILIVVAPTNSIPLLHQESSHSTSKRTKTIPSKLPQTPKPYTNPTSRTYSLEEVQQVVDDMSKHFIVCAGNQIARSAVNKLDPSRPFVIVTDDAVYTETLLERGFCVIHGDPTQDETLLRAGADRALATMIALHDEGDTVLAVISARTISQHLLITAAAAANDNIQKIRLAGADRVINPFSVAAQYILLSTTRPTVSSFFHHVLYNYHDGIETTEIYMEDHAAWIGQSIRDLNLSATYNAHIVGIRHQSGTFSYAPPMSYTIQKCDVLIIVTRMQSADKLRTAAHGSATKRPNTLRRTGTHPKH